MKLNATLTDADCGAVESHDHIDGWHVRLYEDGTWFLWKEHEGASSVSCYCESGEYEIESDVLQLTAKRARSYCDIGDPSDRTGEGTEWTPVEPRGMFGLEGANVTLAGEARTIHWYKSEECEDVENETARRKELERKATEFSHTVSRLADQYRNLRRPVIASALKACGGDPDQARALLQPQQDVAAQFHDDESAAIYKVFCDWDTNGDGVISRAELECVLTTLGVPRIEDILQAVDTNGDGQIDFEEFCVWLTGSKERASEIAAASAATSVRFSVESRAHVKGVGELITGKVEEGTLVEGKDVRFLLKDSDEKQSTGKVKCIMKNHKTQKHAEVGEVVTIKVAFGKGCRRPEQEDTMIYSSQA